MPWRKGNRLHLVTESEASGQVAQVFSEAKAALGIGYVPLAFQAFAAYPSFLAYQWKTLRPLLGTREFFELASRVRAEAYTFVHNYFKVPGLSALPQAAAIAEQMWSAEAEILLLMTVQVQALDGPIGVAGDHRPADRVAQSVAPSFITVESAPAPMRRLLDEIRMEAELPYYSDALRAVAQTPDLLYSAWHALKPAMQSIFYEQAVLRMRESAWNCSQEIPLVIEMEYSSVAETGVSTDEISAVTRLTDLMVRGSAVSLLNAAFVKIGLEGGNQMEALAADTADERVA